MCSLKLATLTGLPLTHLNAESWQPGWVRPSGKVGEQRVQELITPEAWILDGTYTSTVGLRADRADTVVVLASPRALCLYRAVRRALGNRRPDRLALGKEPLDFNFLKFIWNFPVVWRKQEAGLRARPHLRVLRLRSDAQVQARLETVRLELAPAAAEADMAGTPP